MLNINKNDWYLWLPVLAVLSLPLGRSVELFVVIMAGIGIYDLVKNHNHVRQNSAVKLFSLLFLLLWLPSVASIFDAVNFDRTLKTSIGIIRFYFVGVFIINRLSSVEIHYKIALGFVAIVSFWALDGWLQAVIGTDLFGIHTAKHAGRISGIFGENARLGLTIVPFFAMSVLALRHRFGLYAAMAIGLLLSATIFMSGDRAAWVSLVAALGMLTLLNWKAFVGLKTKHYILGIILIGGLFTTLWSLPNFQKRVSAVEVGFDGSYDAINKASSFRLPLWETAYKMFEANPINGVGVRSFRYAYPDYASPTDPFVDFSLPRAKQKGQTHAHQVVLEFASETGTIGLIGYFSALLIIYFKLWPLVYRSQGAISLGYVVAVSVALFPINTHQAFFSSHWGQIVWMLIALSLSAIAAENGQSKLAMFNKDKSSA